MDVHVAHASFLVGGVSQSYELTKRMKRTRKCEYPIVLLSMRVATGRTSYDATSRHHACPPHGWAPGRLLPSKRTRHKKATQHGPHLRAVSRLDASTSASWQ
eukprot:scaffold42802_cov31-Tisochrysis_lutea.AAC.7